MTPQETFEKLALENIQRDGIQNLLFNLSKTDFYTAPASTKYHDSCEGGLVKHSLNVYYYMREECNIILTSRKNPSAITYETMAILGLFHDICKANYYSVSTRNTKDENGKWIQVPYYTVDDFFPFGHGEKSVYMIQDQMKLTPEEALAIRWHMGGFEPEQNYKYLNVAYGKTPLCALLHIADMKATYLE